ncbi:MAG: FecR domain-containing protein [Polyangiales bacterium]
MNSEQPEDLLSGLGEDWDPIRVDANLGLLHAKMRAQAKRRAAMRAGVALVAVLALIFYFAPKEERVGAHVQLADGSTATPLESGGEVVVDSSGDSLTVLSLVSGGAVFRVERNPGRTFRVVAEDVVVEVIGTRFRVEVLEESVEVEVFEGIVRARQGAQSVELRRGMTQVFELGAGVAEAPNDDERSEASEGLPQDVALELPAEEPEPEPEIEEPAEAEASPQATERRDRSNWRELAREGEYDRAYDALEGASRPRGVADLMLAADAARFSGNSLRAVGFLREVRSAHRQDPRAGLAAFTEGRILLLQLGRPREAATAFSAARRLSPTAALAEDALAREVEAHSRAGDSSRAETLGRRYIELYPEGRRMAAVRHHAGLND